MIYKFQTKNPEEAWAMMKAMDLYLCLWDLDQDFFRSHLKHNPDDLSGEQLDILEKGRDALYEIMASHGVDFDNVS
jgi:hypothetical protein